MWAYSNHLILSVSKILGCSVCAAQEVGEFYNSLKEMPISTPREREIKSVEDRKI